MSYGRATSSYGAPEMAGIVGLFATRPLAYPERAAVRRAARSLDFSGVSLQDIREHERLLVARVHHAHPPARPLATSPRGLSVIFDGTPRMPDAGGADALHAWLTHLDDEGLDAFRRLDGSFAAVVHDPRAGRVILVADRFNSRPLYYRSDASVLAFASQASLLLGLPGPAPRLDPLAVVQFFAFQAMLDERTFLDGVRALPPAGLLDFPDGPSPPLRYWWWRPPVDDGHSAATHAERLTEPMVGATRRLIGDGRGLALLLSGGLDSRAVVACAPQPLAAVTLADFDNNEVGLARAIARSRGFPFTFVRRHPHHYVALIDRAVAMGDGAHRYDHAHFAFLRGVLPPEISALALAYGFDRYLKGNSLPRQRRRFRGRAADRVLLPLPADLELGKLARVLLTRHTHFLWGTAPLTDVFRPPYRDHLEAMLLETLEGLLRPHWDHCPDATARFEVGSAHMLLGRHTAFLSVLSIRHFFEDRVILTDNALFDAVMRTPPRLRVDGRAYRTAMARLAPDVWRIHDANTGSRPSTLALVAHLRERTRELGARWGFGEWRRPLPDPAFTQESWPNFPQLIRHREGLAKRIAGIVEDPDALPPDVFDSARINQLLQVHLSEKANHAALLLLLLTFGTWHRRHIAGRPVPRDADGPPPLEVMS